MSCFVDIYDSPYFKKGTREMNTVMMTQTTTHRGVTSSKLCTMIDGKKFCEVQETSPREVGMTMLGIFGAGLMWVIFSFITYKVIQQTFKVKDDEGWGFGAILFSLFAPIAYLGLFLALFG